jgi:hypothetical protein
LQIRIKAAIFPKKNAMQEQISVWATSMARKINDLIHNEGAQ